MGLRAIAAACTLLIPLTLLAQGPLTFETALARAVRMRTGTMMDAEHAAILDALPSQTMPSVRAETSLSSAENLNLLSDRIERFDAFTTIVAIDYPLLDRGAERRRRDTLRTDAQLLRGRALDESVGVFHDTLEAFAQLYLAQERLQLLQSGATRAAELRRRAHVLLEGGEISNITAAQWQDQALATESQLVDLELQRLEAETRLRQLTGERSSGELRVSLDLEDGRPNRGPESIVEGDTAVARASLNESRQQLVLQEAVAARKPQLLLSAFGGIAAVPGSNRPETDEGTFGIYGLRMSLSLPMFDPASARRIAEARLQLHEAARVREVTEAATRNRIDLLWLALDATEKRLELLTDAVQVARLRQESVARLVAAGARPEADLVETANATARRESDRLAVRVERWKLLQRIRHASGTHPAATPARPSTSVSIGGTEPALH
jgi:outer membrane protein TolC